GGPAEKAGIQVGDELGMPDGSPFTSVGAFRGSASVRILDRRGPTGSDRSVLVAPDRINALQAFLQATVQSVRIMSINRKRIGYIHLWTMGSPAFRRALDNAVTGRLKNTDGLILDLRDGYGGEPLGYGDIFFGPQISLDTRERSGSVSRSITAYSQPMVALINHGTRSAKEFLCYQLRKTRRADLVGTPTAGAFLGAQIFPIPPDGLVELPVVSLRVDGVRLEGRGVAPDLDVPPTGIYTSNDRQLLRAEEILAPPIPQAVDSSPATPRRNHAS
ncbi:MAG TPA: S41 family peptidase, partial [Chthonomonadales bacterium]|nr:S41 family peptidase [Chthonomonadales bacterium]